MSSFTPTRSRNDREAGSVEMSDGMIQAPTGNLFELPSHLVTKAAEKNVLSDIAAEVLRFFPS
jgi:hypothetical protein